MVDNNIAPKDILYEDWSEAIDDFGQNENNFHLYQAHQLDRLSDQEIIDGLILAYKIEPCKIQHSDDDVNTLETDECRIFHYPEKMGFFNEHFIMRWFEQWATQRGRKRLIGLPKRLKETLAFM